jgi:hypothetical protein
VLLAAYRRLSSFVLISFVSMSRITSTAKTAAIASEVFMPGLLDTAIIAIPAIALASIGGIGVVGGGIAFGLSSLELGAIGALGGFGARQALKKQTERPATPAPRVRIRFTEAEVPTDRTSEIDDLRSGRF